MKIDVFAHLLPPRYLHERNSRADARFASQYARYATANRGLTDLSLRFSIMDKFPDVRQILAIVGSNIERITTNGRHRCTLETHNSAVSVEELEGRANRSSPQKNRRRAIRSMCPQGAPPPAAIIGGHAVADAARTARGARGRVGSRALAAGPSAG